MSRTQRIFDDIDMSPMPMEMGRNYLSNPFSKKKNEEKTKYGKIDNEANKLNNIGSKARGGLTAKQYVGASCCPDAASYPCAVCCTLNPLQCLATCCCPT